MPENRLLIQVVPQLRPAACGVSDHAISLAQELEARFGIDTAFVVLNSTEPCDSPFPREYCKPARLAEVCNSLSKGQAGAILVHYSGYGYSPDGAPFPLVEALQNTRKSGQFRIGAYFHELYATGMPWRSAFWHTNRQKQVARGIAQECDLIASNLSSHSDWLEREVIKPGRAPVQRLPVFSNVGESVEIARTSARRPVIVVFGLPHTRRQSYRCMSQLGDMLKGLGVEEILDAGAECGAPSDLSGIPVRCTGILAAADLGGLLAQSIFGFVPYSRFSLAKSGILAALCAHGTIPIVAKSFSEEVDGLKDGVHLISARTAKPALAAGLDLCSAAAWNWYSGHRLKVHAGTYSRLLVQPASEAGSAVFAVAGVEGK
jgi:hypothetical protein